MDYVDCVFILCMFGWIQNSFYKPIPALLPTANESRFLRNKFLVIHLNNFVTSL